METFTFPHTRSTGKRLTYEVKVTPGRYAIYLDGKLLKDWSRPAVVVGDVSDPEATMVFAINDIEHLVGMDEE